MLTESVRSSHRELSHLRASLYNVTGLQYEIFQLVLRNCGKETGNESTLGMDISAQVEGTSLFS